MVVDGGSLTAKTAVCFIPQIQESTITLSDVDITNAEDSEFFLKCTGNANEKRYGVQRGITVQIASSQLFSRKWKEMWSGILSVSLIFI